MAFFLLRFHILAFVSVSSSLSLSSLSDGQVPLWPPAVCDGCEQYMFP